MLQHTVLLPAAWYTDLPIETGTSIRSLMRLGLSTADFFVRNHIYAIMSYIAYMRGFIVSDHSRISFYKLILATQHGSLQRFVGITWVGRSRNSVQREGVMNLRPLNAKTP